MLIFCAHPYSPAETHKTLRGAVEVSAFCLTNELLYSTETMCAHADLLQYEIANKATHTKKPSAARTLLRLNRAMGTYVQLE